ncbi:MULTISPECIES: biopolymer transporter ExbD [unclassified Mucilaginibacter]|uniref:ExbD/TolR family protein n=1 Tax=unclassified Mucilaginibacter TaxID=2617802 RepID=UPI002AC91DC0|nr:MULTISPECIES: biopolymer transporter ExbD [unclassified Mucilaginibacter]MEB0263967.1 biopolymer transporter ExbD [Mucilaginibacter sp. 10I4]MEB0279831.1 biopolymer transporter ExbD [Mucilaginibacter sp. 10B2]MEB0303245.1 biopolymer transporter ExbD [Mucilaginibacter sp. 5C4]WPX24197.1 biopolymer transporter ExbD [Mucilaginibacter sp. 5C4]
MPRVKVQRKSTSIDMTAMCDVAFLLLTFFILTAKPRTEDPVPVDIPASSTTQPIPDDNVLMLTIAEQKVFFTVDGNDIRIQTLKQMGEKYNVQFTPEEQKKFSGTPIFGVPMNQLKSFLSLDAAQKKEFKQSGIPADTTANNELADWIREARKADVALHNKALRIAIKGDNKEEYPTIKKVIGILQKQKLDKFSLITTIRAAPKTN